MCYSIVDCIFTLSEIGGSDDDGHFEGRLHTTTIHVVGDYKLFSFVLFMRDEEKEGTLTTTATTHTCTYTNT